MSATTIGLIGIFSVLGLIAFRVPIGIAMGVIGLLGTWAIAGLDTVRYAVGTAPFNSVFPYSLSVLPLFVMMGVFAAYSGMSRNLFLGANALVGHLRGGLAVATIGACAVFGAICGSSLATSAAMAKVALPEMRRLGYDPRLSSGAVAAGGTLGIMIPPSLALALYGLLTQTSIGALYLAGLVPGLLGMLLYMGAVSVTTWRDPSMGPPGPRQSWGQRFEALKQTWDVICLFAIVLGGLFAGWFSPTEAAAVGVFGAVIIMAARGVMTRASFKDSLWETATTVGYVFLILAGAGIFAFFIDLSTLPHMTVELMQQLRIDLYLVLIIIILAYLVLGCLLDALSMLLLTIPFVFPIIKHLGFDPVWFGILMVTVIEIGLIHPPFGMNLYVVQAAAPGIKQGTIVRGIIPFVLADLVRVVLLIAFPALSLALISSLR